MSFSVYVRIYTFDEACMPPPFKSEEDFWDFVNKHEDEALLSGSSGGGVMYWTLNKCEVRFDLPALADLSNLGNHDQKFSQSTAYVKRITLQRLDRVCHDIQAVIDIARTAPESLLFDEPAFPEFKLSQLAKIARATSDDSVESDLSGYQDGEEWFYFFSYLFTVRKICEDAKAQNKIVLQLFFEG